MWLYKTSTFLMRNVTLVYVRMKLVGDRDHIPADGPLLVTANHSSFLDPWFIAAAFPRPISYLINEHWYNRSTTWRWFFRSNGVLPIRGDARRTIDDVVAHLRDGRVVGIFPEGRISADGTIGRFKSGFAKAAAATGAPVVPLGLRNNYEIMPRTRRFPRAGTVEVHAGRPMSFAEKPRENVRQEELRAFRDRVFQEVCRLSGRGARARNVRPAGTSQTDPRPSGGS